MDYMIWFVIKYVMWYIIDVHVGLANLCSGIPYSESLIYGI